MIENFGERLREYVTKPLALSRHEGANPLVVFYKVAIANARFGLGIKHFCFYKLTKKKVSSYHEYMHKPELEELQRHLNSRQGRKICDDKLLYYKTCLEHGIATPEVIATLSDQFTEGMLHDVPYIKNAGHLMTLLANSAADTFVFKPVTASHGVGISRCSLADGKLYNDNAQEVDPALYLDTLRSEGGSYLLQPALKPHMELRPIMPGKTLGTVRMVTINDKKGVRVEYVCAKIPVGSTIADNFADGKSGNLLAEIDIKTGTIGTTFSAAKGFPGLIEACENHPDSNFRIPGFNYPKWAEMLSTVEDAAKKFDFLYTIGWDVALTENGPCLIEANWRYDMDILQIVMQRGLKPELIEKLQEQHQRI